MNNSFWAKLNYKVNTQDSVTNTEDSNYKEPECNTKGNKIIMWEDTRSQPTQTQINNVTQAQIDNFYIERETLTLESLINHLEDNGISRPANAPLRMS